MEMIKISQTELKVMMSPEDMRKYELECDNTADITPARRSALRSILREAHNKTGFSSCGEKLLVRMFPSRDGGCEMFVTRLSSKNGTDSERRTPVLPMPLPEDVFIYSFSELENLLCACKRLLEAGYRSDSAAYSDNGRRAWYLVIGVKSPLAEEMGGSLMRSGAMYYINEYCSLLCLSAVSELAQFA